MEPTTRSYTTVAYAVAGDGNISYTLWTPPPLAVDAAIKTRLEAVEQRTLRSEAQLATLVDAKAAEDALAATRAELTLHRELLEVKKELMAANAKLAAAREPMSPLEPMPPLEPNPHARVPPPLPKPLLASSVPTVEVPPAKYELAKTPPTVFHADVELSDSMPAPEPKWRCKLCFDRAITTVDTPCGHAYSCATCRSMQATNVCRMCKQAVTAIVHLYPQ